MVATEVKSKFKVGDYIVGEGRVFSRVMAVINDGVQPVYATMGPKDKKPTWETEFELVDELKLVKQTPDFAKYKKLKPGDVLLTGKSTEGIYTTVLARVGDLCLISLAPQKKAIEQVEKLADQIKELTEGEVDVLESLGDDSKSKMRKYSSTTWANKVAGGWETTDWLCLMNWPIVSE